MEPSQISHQENQVSGRLGASRPIPSQRRSGRKADTQWSGCDGGLVGGDGTHGRSGARMRGRSARVPDRLQRKAGACESAAGLTRARVLCAEGCSTAAPREDRALRLNCFIKHNELDTEHFRSIELFGAF